MTLEPGWLRRQTQKAANGVIKQEFIQQTVYGVFVEGELVALFRDGPDAVGWARQIDQGMAIEVREL